MDPLTQVQLSRSLVDIDSTTGREQEAARFLSGLLTRLGYRVMEQAVADGRFNVMATRGKPVVVFSTHMDCVPPFFPSRVESGRLYGRGSCDAKGIAIAQVAAAERLHARGESRIGLLFVVGEERGSDGAKLANGVAPGSTFLVNGEPTDNRLGLATRGVYRVRLRATGRAAHSSQPALGESAIDKLVDAIVRLRETDWPADPDLGKTFYSIGLINGGIAPNVISPEADAELMFRTVGDHGALRSLIEAEVGHLVAVDDVLVVPPVKLRTVPGLETAVFSFTTDIPFLDAWGTPLLIGPGSVMVAHTADEYVELAALTEAVDRYTTLGQTLLSHAG